MGKGRDFKKPKSKSSANIQIPPKEEKRDYDSDKPVFSLAFMEYEGPQCISNCETEKKSLIISTLLRLSQKPWKELKLLAKKGGFEAIPRFRFLVPMPIPPHLTPDSTILVAQYDGDGGRMAGYRDKNVYYIIAVGKNLYPH